MNSAALKTWIAEELSDEQRRVFSGATPRTCILASAGSGKTRTLTHLIARDLCSGIPAGGIVAFTFTEKSAEELLARIHAIRQRKMPAADLSGLFVGTIHSWCLHYLRSQPDFYGIAPVDELQMDALVARLYDSLDLAKIYGKPFPRAIEPFLADVEVFFNEHLTLAQVPEHVRPALDSFLSVLEENRLLPYGAMIRNATTQLLQHGPIAELDAVYVDEYQDVNPAQTALIKAMLPAECGLRVVGDDLQSIYNWRGSDVTRILDFNEEFSPAEVFRLSENYRSRPQIVDVANAVAESIDLKDAEKVMRSMRPRTKEGNVHWISTSSDQEQAQAIVEIVRRHHDQGLRYQQMAILLRSVRRAGPPIYDALVSSGIPVESPTLGRDGALAFVEEFLEPVLGWLLAAQTAAINTQQEMEQKATAEALWRSVAPWIAADAGQDGFWDAVNRWHDLLRTPKSESYNIRDAFYDLLDHCGTRVRDSDSRLMTALGIVSQIMRSVEESHRRRLKGHPRRTAIGVISEVKHAVRRKCLEFGESIPINRQSHGVMLTTIHQSKGLEWPVVVLPQLDYRRFPLPRRPATTSFAAEITGRYGTTLDEERRLFYVAITRARERLFFLDTASSTPTRRSVFLKDLVDSGALPPEGMPPERNRSWRVSPDQQSFGRVPVTVGVSDLLLYLECPYQYGLRRVAGIVPAVGDELGFGAGLHEVVRRRAEAPRAWDARDIVTEVERHVHLPLSSEIAEQRARGAIGERIRSLDQLGMFQGTQRQETPVDLFLEDGIITGIIDSVEVEADESLVLRDWKANLHEEYIERYTRQLQVYVSAVRTRGQRVRRAEVVDVAASAHDGKVAAVEVDVREEAIDDLMTHCREAISSIASGDFPARPETEICVRCDVRRICGERVGD